MLGIGVRAVGRPGFLSAKIKGGLDPDRDISRLRTVGEVLRRNARSPALMLDVNESWGRHQAVRFLSRIEDEIELTWVEEPVQRSNITGNVAVARSARAAVATGENLTGLEQYRPLLDAGAMGVVQAGSVWGITHFLRVATLALGHDLPISPVGYHGNVLAHARDRRTEPPRVRAAGPDLPDRHHRRPDHRGRRCSARGRAGPRHRDR